VPHHSAMAGKLDDTARVLVHLGNCFSDELNPAWHHGRMLCQAIASTGAHLFIPVYGDNSNKGEIHLKYKDACKGFGEHYELVGYTAGFTTPDQSCLTKSFSSFYSNNVDLPSMTHFVYLFPYTAEVAFDLCKAKYENAKRICIITREPEQEAHLRKLISEVDVVYTIGDWLSRITNTTFSGSSFPKERRRRLTLTTAQEYIEEMGKVAVKPPSADEECRVISFTNHESYGTLVKLAKSVIQALETMQMMGMGFQWRIYGLSAEQYEKLQKDVPEMRGNYNIRHHPEPINLPGDLANVLRASTLVMFPEISTSSNPIIMVALHLGVPCFFQMESCAGQTIKRLLEEKVSLEKVVIQEQDYKTGFQQVILNKLNKNNLKESFTKAENIKKLLNPNELQLQTNEMFTADDEMQRFKSEFGGICYL
jgi:hypothetical protein